MGSTRREGMLYDQRSSRNIIESICQLDAPSVAQFHTERPDEAGGSAVGGAGVSSVLTERQRERELRVHEFRRQQTEEAERRRQEVLRQNELAVRQKENAEHERLRRIGEFQQKESERRSMVEDRRRQLQEQQSERFSQLARRHEEREAMLETRRRHQTSQIMFGFGSATPRWGLQPGPLSTGSPAKLTPKRSPSSPLDGGLSSVAGSSGASSYGRQRSDEDPVSARRLRPDLVPALPSPQSRAASAARATRSRCQPGKAVSMPRLDRLPVRRPCSAGGRARVDCATSMSRSTAQLATGTGYGTRLLAATTSASGVLAASSVNQARSGSALSHHNQARADAARARLTPRRPRPLSIAHMPSASAKPTADTNTVTRAHSARRLNTVSSASCTEATPPAAAAGGGRTGGSASATRYQPPSGRRTPAQVKAIDALKKDKSQQKKPMQKMTRSADSQSKVEPCVLPTETASVTSASAVENGVAVTVTSSTSDTGVSDMISPSDSRVDSSLLATEQSCAERIDSLDLATGEAEDCSASFQEDGAESQPGEKRKAGYQSEHEARAALAEKRRLARVRAEEERAAELERQRLLEEKQQRDEEEEMRLAQEARLAEQLRLQRAIEEAEQERLASEARAASQEQERRQREQQEVEARQLAETARQQAALELQREERERLKRRSRVVEIMSRTRGAGGSQLADKMAQLEGDRNDAMTTKCENNNSNIGQVSEVDIINNNNNSSGNKKSAAGDSRESTVTSVDISAGVDLKSVVDDGVNSVAVADQPSDEDVLDKCPRAAAVSADGDGGNGDVEDVGGTKSTRLGDQVLENGSRLLVSRPDVIPRTPEPRASLSRSHSSASTSSSLSSHTSSSAAAAAVDDSSQSLPESQSSDTDQCPASPTSLCVNTEPEEDQSALATLCSVAASAVSTPADFSPSLSPVHAAAAAAAVRPSLSTTEM